MARPAARPLLLTALLALGGPACLPELGGGRASAQVPVTPPTERTAEPGDFLTLPLPVPGGAASYAVEATLPAGWVLLTSEATAENGTAALALHLPEEATAGRYALTFLLRGPEGTAPLPRPVTVTVAAHPDFEIGLPGQDRVRAGETRTYTARVTNTGNARDTLRLEVEGSGTVTPDRVTLAPGESAGVQVTYTQRNLGNADTLRLRGRSTAQPGLERDALLILSVGTGLPPGSGPQLNWSVVAAPQVGWNTAVRAQPGGDPPGPVPTLPGLPTGTGTPDTATPTSLGQDSPTWAWGGALSASLGGDLSDYARGLLSYSVTRLEDGKLTDHGAAQLAWGPLTVTGRSALGFRRLGVEAEYERGPYTYGGGVSRDVLENGRPTFSVSGHVRHASGVSVNAAYRFGVADGEGGRAALGAGWQRRFGAFVPSLEVSALHSAQGWGVGLRQGLDYENRVLLARQEYRYDSLNRAQQLDVRVSSRQLSPFGVSGSLSVSGSGNVWRYGLSGTATYRPDSTFGVTLQAAYGSGGLNAGLSALKEWRQGSADVFVDGQLNYAAGQAGGRVQVTGVLPAASGTVLLRGTLGYQSGLLYGAGAGYTRGALSVAGGAQGGPGRTRLTLSAAYRPTRGLNATADYVLSRQPEGREQRVYASLGYSADRWGAALLAAYGAGPGENPAFTYGARVGAQVLPGLGLSAQAERTADRTRVALRGTFTPAGAFRTPEGVVNLFGGRRAGTLRLLAFLDRDRDGVQDGNEPGVASRFTVGGQEVQTDARGEGSALLPPGEYDVQLAGDVLAQYLIPTLPGVTVPLRQTVTVRVPVREVGSVQGQLTDEAGHPLAGVPVRVEGAVGTANAVTDGSGFYRVGGLDFGTYTLTAQPDPALYRVPDPVPVTLDAAHVLTTRDLRLGSAATLTALAGNDLTLTVTLPGEALPPGAALPVRVQVEPAADTVRLEGLGEPVPLTSGDGHEWTGRVPIPAGQTTTEVQVVATRGAQSGSERALLLIDPALPAATLQVSPSNALPAQPLTLRAVLYLPGTRVEVQDETGRLTPLTATASASGAVPGGGAREYTLELPAHDAPGTHTVTLLVDGQPRGEATYRVLGRP